MADDVTIRQGTGSNIKTIAADDVGGKMHQRVKISHGSDGQATDTSSNNPLPTTDAALATIIGAREDAKSTATDTTAVSAISLWKQISASVQSIVSALASLTVTSNPTTATSGTVTALASSASSAQLLAANSARKGLFLINTDVYAVLIKFGTTASATSFNIRLAQNAQYEMFPPIYTGRIDAIWEGNGSGSLYATEL